MGLKEDIQRDMEKFGQELLDEQIKIHDQENMKASGETRKTFQLKSSPGHVVLMGPEHLEYLERGRGPSGGGNTGTPSLFEKIKVWMRHKGIVPQGITEDSLAFLITRKIHQEGTRRHRMGLRSGIISKALSTETVQAGMVKIAKFNTEAVAKELFKSLKK